MCAENSVLSGQISHFKSQLGSLSAEKQTLTDLLEVKKQEIMGLKIEIDQMQYHYAMANAERSHLCDDCVRKSKESLDQNLCLTCK